MNKWIVSGLVALAVIAPAGLEAQVARTLWAVETPPASNETVSLQIAGAPTADEVAARDLRLSGHPWLRTLATLGAAAGGYAYADARATPSESDVKYVPIAAGAGGAALAGILFSNANPLRVVFGAALSALPAAALSTFLEGSLKEEDVGELPLIGFSDIPLIAFSIPQGLLTSAFAQDRR